MSIKLSDNVTLPRQIATDTIAIMAKRGKGKTYAGLKLAEELLADKVQCIIVDVVGVCWGLRCKPDGSPGGADVVIAGGDHADVPIADTNAAGAALGSAAVKTGRSFILDVSHMSKAGARRVVTGLLNEVYQLKGRAEYRTPLHIMIDEADEFAPQKASGEVAACFGAVDTAVRRGRARGLGFTLITQRPAVLNKDVLTQAEVLIAMGLIAKLDRSAIQDWITTNGDDDTKATMINELAHLGVGEAYVWTPEHGIFAKTKIGRRSTYDSSSTPKAGPKTVAPKLKQLDVAELAKMLSAEPEKPKKASSSSADQKKIAELELTIADLKHQVELTDEWWRDRIKSLLSDASDQSARADKTVPERKLQPSNSTKPANAGVPSVGKPSKKAEDRLLESLAWWDVAGERELGTVQMAVMAGISPNSSTLRAARATLRDEGLVEYVRGSGTKLTPAGLERSRSMVPVQVTLDAYHDRLLAMIGNGVGRRVFEVVRESSSALSKDAIAEAVEVSPASSTIRAALASLRKLGLISQREPVEATDLMFPQTLML